MYGDLMFATRRSSNVMRLVIEGAGEIELVGAEVEECWQELVKVFGPRIVPPLKKMRPLVRKRLNFKRGAQLTNATTTLVAACKAFELLPDPPQAHLNEKFQIALKKSRKKRNAFGGLV